MIIEIPRLKTGSTDFVGDESSSILELDSPGTVPGEKIHYELLAELISNELLVRGRVSMAVKVTCSRCGKVFQSVVEQPDFACIRRIEDPNESVDLTGEIREDMLLALPIYPICKPDCKGLCAQCGCNLNVKKCKCKPPVDLRWGALDGLLVERREDRNARTKKTNI